jgi:PKD repeat protein
MKIYSVKKRNMPKLAVLGTGLVIAAMAITMTSTTASAHVGYAQDCTGCHGSSGSIAATPSTATPAAGANYTVQLSPAPRGYWITGTGVSLTGSASSVTVKAPAAAGVYTYDVYVRASSGAKTTYKITVGPVTPPPTTPPVVVRPVASFTAAPATGTAPLTVALTDTSTGTPTSWAWNFGNGTTSTVRNPSVTYNAAGTYTVTHTATNAGGTSTAATRVITVAAVPPIPPTTIPPTTPPTTIPPTTPPTTIPPTTPPTTIPPTTPPTTIPPTTPPVPSSALISRLSDSSANSGDRITIYGSGFGQAGVVKFGTVTASVSSWSTTRISVRVPREGRSSRVSVTVTPRNGTASNALSFRYDSDSDDD